MSDDLPRIHPLSLLAAYARAAVRPKRRRKSGRHKATPAAGGGRMRRADDGTLTYSPSVYLPPDGPLRSADQPDQPDDDAAGTPPAAATREDT